MRLSSSTSLSVIELEFFVKRIILELAGFALCLCFLMACGSEAVQSPIPETPAPETHVPEALPPVQEAETIPVEKEEHDMLLAYDKANNLYLASRDGLTVLDMNGDTLRRFHRFYDGSAGLVNLTVPGDGTVLLSYGDGCSVIANLRSNALTMESRNEMSLLFSGYWDYFIPGDDTPAMELFLTGDGYYQAYRRTPEGADPGFEYVGQWLLDGGENLPEQIAFPFLGKTYDAEIEGFTSLGNYYISDIALWDGTYCVCLSGEGETDFFREIFGDTRPVLRKRLDEPVIPAAELCRTNDTFSALCWGVRDGDGGKTLWISAEGSFRKNKGQLPAVQSYYIEDETEFSHDGALTFSVEVQTDETGQIAAFFPCE